MSIREMNKQKKWLNCLKCGRRIHTDRCHRICPKCNQKNAREGRIRFMAVGIGRGISLDGRLGSDILGNDYLNS